MTMLKRVIGFTVLLALLAFPASAFASNHSSGDKGGGLLSGILSLFGIGSSSGNKSGGNSYDKYYTDLKNKVQKIKEKEKDKNYKQHDFWDWLKDNSWWEEFCWWTDNQGDSGKLWEKYFCY